MASTPASAPREREDTKTLVRLGGDRDSARLPDAGADGAAPSADGSDAPALRGGAATSSAAPALRGGADGSDAPALRGGADGSAAPALRGGAATSSAAPALCGGAAAQRDVLREIAEEGDATGNRVQLWFKGLKAPVRARVRINGERIRLETLLPFLEIDSEVAIARTEDSARLHARIAQVSLVASTEQPVPRLSVEVELARQEANDQATAGAPDAVSSKGEATEDATIPASTRRTLPPGEMSSGAPQASRLLPWVAAFVLGAVGGAAGTGAWLAPWLRAPFAAPAHRHDVQHASPERERAPEPAAVAEAVAVPVAAVPVPVPLPSPAVAPVPPETDELAAAPAAAEPEAPAEAEAVQEKAQPEPSTASSEPAPEPAAARGLEIESANGRTEIFIPMQGSAEGMERYALTTPGVSFTLPHAQATIAVSNYLVDHRPLVRRVWLREHEGGVQVRIILPRASIHDEARFDADGLHIVLRP